MEWDAEYKYSIFTINNIYNSKNSSWYVQFASMGSIKDATRYNDPVNVNETL